MIGHGLFFDRGESADKGLVVGEYFSMIYGVDAYVVSSSCEMRVGVVVQVYVFVVALCLRYFYFRLTII